MNIVIVTREDFPFGGAATNRMLTYLPGLVAMGHKVTVLCLFLSREENARLLDSNAEYVYKGVCIKYIAGRKRWPVGEKKYLTKIVLLIKERFCSYYYLFRNRRVIDLIQVYASETSIYERFGKWCRRFDIKYMIERSELPAIFKYRERYKETSKGRLFVRRTEKAYGLFDGWILETQILVDYYSKFFASNAKCLIVPMTVEVDRFAIDKNPNPRFGKYLAYCGNMSEIDGISVLIKAFAIIHKKYNDVKLILAGDSSDVPAQKILSETLGVKDDVLFLGRLSRDEVPHFLADATALVLASPTSERACATMPCKVGEYLCTGNPVVVTGIGEINKYLKDGESAYLSPPDSEIAFAQKLDEMLSDISRAEKIGKKGKEVSLRHFGSEAQVKRIEAFYHELIDK